MKIVALTNNNGPNYHRLLLPLSQMEGVEVSYVPMQFELELDKWLTDDLLDGADLVLYSRAMEPPVMVWLLENKRRVGFKVGVDMDDHWELGADHILYDAENEARLHRVQKAHLVHADFVTTTHERLAAEIFPFNQKVYILPNAIPRVGQFDIKTEPSDKIRLFWQGSRTHKKDVEILTRPMVDLIPYRGAIKMIMGGVETDEDEKPNQIWVDMKSTYTAGHALPSAYILGEPVENYYYMYEQADVCLIPLVRNRFTTMKSNLKVLEAANMGLPAVVSQVHPYLGMPVNYCLRGSDWTYHIKRLLNSSQLRMDQGMLLKEWAEQNFNFSKINEERLQVYRHHVSVQSKTA